MRIQVFAEMLGIGYLLSDIYAVTLLSNPRYYLRGKNQDQRIKAANIAISLGMKVGYTGAFPYVDTQDNFDRLGNYLITHEVEGYWYYDFKS